MSRICHHGGILGDCKQCVRDVENVFRRITENKESVLIMKELITSGQNEYLMRLLLARNSQG